MTDLLENLLSLRGVDESTRGRWEIQLELLTSRGWLSDWSYSQIRCDARLYGCLEERNTPCATNA